MTIARLTDVLAPAAAQGYAIAGLVVLGWEDLCGFVEAAEATGIPIILQAGPGLRRHMPVPVLGKMFRHVADQARVPVVCHIDHAYTLEECLEGIDHGFSSVMIDGSKLPIADNIKLTAAVVAKAHAAGVCVEGEVGFVGYANGLASQATLPAEAALFDRESGADAMAISVGNVHLSTERTVGIDFSALAAIEAATRLPLVLHGGSGIPVPMRQRLASGSRVAKFNIGTELRIAFGAALRHQIMAHPHRFDRLELLSATVLPIRQAAEHVITSLRYPERPTTSDAMANDSNQI